jgi:hypothetical protein
MLSKQLIAPSNSNCCTSLQEQYLAMLAKSQVNWNTADDFVDELVPHVAAFRPRDDK